MNTRKQGKGNWRHKLSIKLYQGDALTVLKTLAAGSVQCCVTSPPYWGLRDYGIEGQIGLEPTPELYVEHLVEIFREVKRVLKKDGTFWLNLGDSYAGSCKGEGGIYELSKKQNSNRGSHYGKDNGIIHKFDSGLKPKDLVGIPWRVALALQADGWWLRQDIIWAKGNPMPESVCDRNTKSHEYIFLLTKSPRYYYDNIAIQERAGGCNDKEMQYLQADFTDRELLQKQSAEGRTVWPVCRLYKNSEKEIRPEIQQNGKGKSERQEILLFGEGAEKKEGISGKLRTDLGTKREISSGDEKTREGRKIQESPEEIRFIRERENNESGAGCPLFCNSERPYGEKTHREEKEILSCQYAMHINLSGMGGHQKEIRIPLCLLPQTKEIRNGSCNSVDERRTPYQSECSSFLPNLQRQEKQSSFRNRRSVWHINTRAFKSAHFATFPPELPEICIKAGSRRNDIILDPFSGAGTTGLVANRLGRQYIGIELNSEYIEMSKKRIYDDAPLFYQEA